MRDLYKYLDPRKIIEVRQNGIYIDLLKIIVWIIILYCISGTLLLTIAAI